MERELEPSVGPAGGFICDEMGLGNYTHYRYNDSPSQGTEQKTLIVLPKSLLEQWETILRFTGVKALIYHGAQTKNIGAEELDTCRIVITTYGMIATRKVSEGKQNTLANYGKKTGVESSMMKHTILGIIIPVCLKEQRN